VRGEGKKIVHSSWKTKGLAKWRGREKCNTAGLLLARRRKRTKKRGGGGDTREVVPKTVLVQRILN